MSTLTFPVIKVWQEITDITVFITGTFTDLQNVGTQEVYFFEDSVIPVDTETGFVLSPRVVLTHKKEDGVKLFVRGNGTDSLLKFNKIS